jgi:hypothetical protein
MTKLPDFFLKFFLGASRKLSRGSYFGECSQVAIYEKRLEVLESYQKFLKITQ